MPATSKAQKRLKGRPVCERTVRRLRAEIKFLREHAELLRQSLLTQETASIERYEKDQRHDALVQTVVRSLMEQVDELKKQIARTGENANASDIQSTTQTNGSCGA
jgi:hypothetical protein